jgi:hypothetical protein
VVSNDLKKYMLNSSVDFLAHNESRIVGQTLVNPIPRMFRDNIGEPTFGSNGTSIFYAANYYAARSSDGGKNWQFINPRADFPNDITNGKSTFCCDQRVIYDKNHGIYIWYRQGHEMISNNQNRINNIGRLAISNDTITWHVYDLLANRNVPPNSNISRGSFDFPELAIGKEYLYLSTNYIDKSGNLDADTASNPKSGYYGVVFRFSLDNMSKLGNLNYNAFLDKKSFGIFPAHGFNDEAYFVAHSSDNQPTIRLYSWNESSGDVEVHSTKIDSWNEIRNSKSCLNETNWWCYGEINSKIRSAWLDQNDTINLLWSSIGTFDDGKNWIPYIEAATCYLKENISNVTCERGPYVAEVNNPWMYGAAVPNKEGNIGIVAFYGDNIKIPITLAFGLYNDTEKKWEMMPLVSSSERLPIINEKGLNEYKIGDFLTIRQHIGDEPDGQSLWDAAGYVINGTLNSDVQPYFFVLK